MISTIAAIAGGGALGALSRYGVNTAAFHLLGPGFPWATLGVNVIGSFLMGCSIAAFAHFWQPSEEVRLFLITGFLGAFTTFSTFSLDAVALWERGQMISAAGYISASVILSITALLLGMLLIRNLIS